MAEEYRYVVGATITLFGKFEAMVTPPADPPTYQLADPTNPRCRVQKPNGTVRAYSGVEVTRDSVGRFRCNHVADMAGDHEYEWIGDGAAAAVAPKKRFHVYADIDG